MGVLLEYIEWSCIFQEMKKSLLELQELRSNEFFILFRQNCIFHIDRLINCSYVLSEKSENHPIDKSDNLKTNLKIIKHF